MGQDLLYGMGLLVKMVFCPDNELIMSIQNVTRKVLCHYKVNSLHEKGSFIETVFLLYFVGGRAIPALSAFLTLLLL